MIDEDERIHIWYDQEDYKDFKMERKAAATLAGTIGLESIEKTDFVSCRGIEYMVDKNRLDQKLKLLTKATVAVLRAQTKVFQQADFLGEEPGLASSEVIAFNYTKYSRQAQFEASQRALQQWGASQVETEVLEEASSSTSRRRRDHTSKGEKNSGVRGNITALTSFRDRFRKQLSFKRETGENKEGLTAAIAAMA
jgi:hypothetical protein